MQVPFAIPLAIWAGFADLIPVVGSYAGARPAIVIAFVSPGTGLLVAVYFVVYQQFENYVIVPRVMRGAVDLSPASVIVATLIGASLGGFVGAPRALSLAGRSRSSSSSLVGGSRGGGDELARHRVHRIRRRARKDEAAATETADRRARGLSDVPVPFGCPAGSRARRSTVRLDLTRDTQTRY